MDALAQIAAMADSFEEAAWAAVKAGNTVAADVYWAAANLINETFKENK
ncbi:hypothetical protein [Cryobacterium sp. Sr8]|nr:hypothetical protein [Cryobacterium sp. Sr8]